MTQDPELRVLTGIHHGARCPVQDGTLIGSHGRCDVVLCDDGIAAEAARLRVGAATWGINRHDGAGDTAQEVRFGTPLALGPVLLTVAHAADPWPNTEQGFGTPEPSGGPGNGGARHAAPEREGTEAQAAATSDWDGTSPTEPAQETRHTAARKNADRAQASRRRKGLGLRWAVGGLLIVLVFGSVASFPPAKVPPIPRVQPGRATETDSLLRAQDLLAEQGYAPRIRASLGAEQEVVITGWVRDELEHDRLATALSTIWPLPAMRVGKETDLQAGIDTRMQGLDLHVAIVHPAAGGMAIRGIAGSDAVRQEAYRRWRENAETAAQAPMTLLLATDITDALNQAVAAAGLPEVAATWKDNAVRIDPRGLAPSQRERIRAILDALNPVYMNALLLDGDKSPLNDAVPFRVQTVVGGRQPWVVLDDGTRILVGGTHGAYRLTSVDDGSVIFDGPTTAIIPR